MKKNESLISGGAYLYVSSKKGDMPIYSLASGILIQESK